MRKKEAIRKTVLELTKIYGTHALFDVKREISLPDRSKIIYFIEEMRHVLFPGYFGENGMLEISPESYASYKLNELFEILREQIETALHFEYESLKKSDPISEQAEVICTRFIETLPYIRSMLFKDLQAGFDGDPAATSKADLIISYPGFFAIYVYRMAHELYNMQVPLIPRIMSEYAHSGTGIDINPGAVIGEYFFIDHGTGVVIGETTIIGNHVKLYQGVTLGALSTRSGQQLSGVKRHPTIEDHVTVYANSTVLGGETVIGKNTTIGGNTFITHSVPENSRVSAKAPELVFKQPKNSNQQELWEEC